MDVGGNPSYFLVKIGPWDRAPDAPLPVEKQNKTKQNKTNFRGSKLTLGRGVSATFFNFAQLMTHWGQVGDPLDNSTPA